MFSGVISGHDSRMRLVLLAIMALGLSAVAAGASQQAAQVRLTGAAPVRISGSGFAANDRVSVRFSQSGYPSVAKTVLASPTGSFVARFPHSTLDQCKTWAITANGVSGRRAARRDLIPPPCGIEISP